MAGLGAELGAEVDGIAEAEKEGFDGGAIFEFEEEAVSIFLHLFQHAAGGVDDHGQAGGLGFEDDVGKSVEVGKVHEHIVFGIEAGDVADEAGKLGVPSVARAKGLPRNARTGDGDGHPIGDEEIAVTIEKAPERGDFLWVIEIRH